MFGLCCGNGWHTMGIQLYFPWNNTCHLTNLWERQDLKCWNVAWAQSLSILYIRFIDSMNIYCVAGETGNCHSLWLNVVLWEHKGSTLTLWEEHSRLKLKGSYVWWVQEHQGSQCGLCQPLPPAFLLLWKAIPVMWWGSSAYLYPFFFG